MIICFLADPMALPTEKPPVSRSLRVLAVLSLAFLSVLPYALVSGHGFVLFDDDKYIVGNPWVRGGLTREGVAWAFGTFHAANWHPLTWLSHMLDVEWFGMAPGPHHLVNVALHAVNTVLLFLVFSGMTGEVRRSALVAALFAVHPLHVESVAWVSERKDLLCALFFLLSTGAYAMYARRGGTLPSLAVNLAFGLALLSKPRAVTLPFLLLLLDFWPLGRLAAGQEVPSASRGISPVPFRTLLLEKAPLFAMSAASSVVTWLAQRKGGSLDAAIPFGARAANAAVSYAAYLCKAAWPSGLAVFYPPPAGIGQAPILWQSVGAVLLIAGVTAAALRMARRAPFLCAGWLWYLGMLVPVIGLVKVGAQAMADRYTYLPLTGVFVALAWGVPALLPPFRRRTFVLGAAAGAIVLLLGAAAYLQASYWKDSITLFSHALRVTSGNWMAHYDLALAYQAEGDLLRAESQYREVLRILPDAADAHINLGVVLQDTGRLDEALIHYREALRLSPGDTVARNNLERAIILRRGMGER